MFRLNSLRKKIILTAALCMLGISQAFALVTSCKPSYYGDHLDIHLTFEITNNSTSITPGTTLANMRSPWISMSCLYTEGNDNDVYLRNAMTSDIKNILIDAGVDIFQQSNIGVSEILSLTQPAVPDQPIGTSVIGGYDILMGYTFTVKKGNMALKPFDTGIFLLGYHVNDEGTNVGAPIYARFVGNLTLLCPTPKVDITASNGGGVNFGTISPQDMKSGGVVSKAFNLNMKVNPECETGLNISVRFEPNNNPVLDNKNLDMGNGLQVLLNNSTGDIDYDESYYVGELMPFTPVNLPYTATLSHIPGRDIVSGPFSKTIRVVVSY